ncbi:DUF2529 family protein [Alkalicoccobacillus plakortidis]|uniref:DUF2529 domain-containing protein n=1 Tax=Alkalicoccobacillus plakortidis TaxID=444060 RepID=A0ABT0XLA6_9BACI|nr:DUF2529 family protein [Alkalicoccobacillus plakortidis]MCM2675987.1 DUF2529 domain-containing protein [Alkalicoccobacillus plakortidis]
MLKVFNTQFTGATKALLNKEEELEDAARLLTQAITSNGTVYIAAFGEMKAIEAEALYGKEAFPQAVELKPSDLDSLTERDRVLITSRFSDDIDAIKLANIVSEKNVPIFSITTITEDGANSLVHLSDFILDLNLHQGLVPDEDGSRIGYPASLLGLHAYFLLSLTIREMLGEVEG